MKLSTDTVNLLLELLSTVSVPVVAPDAEEKMRRLVMARDELLAALPSDVGNASLISVSSA